MSSPFGELKLVYKINKDIDEIKIFEKNFVKNHKDKCNIIYKDNIFLLKEYFKKKYIEKEDNKLIITLIYSEDIYDKSYMFHNCKLLEEIQIFIMTKTTI